MKHTKLLLTIAVSCFLSITLLTESRAQVVVQNFDNAVGTFFPDPPTTNQDFFASNPAAVFDLSNYSTDSYEGSGSIKIDYEVGYDAWGGWIVRTTYNVLSGNTSLPYLDLSSGQFLSLWYKVLTPANLTESGTINFEFKLAEFNDAGDRELWLHVTTLDLTDNSGTWKNVTIPLKQDADNTKGFILQLGYIDGVLQLDKIKGFEIAISYQTSATPATTPIGTGSLLLDNLQLFGSYTTVKELKIEVNSFKIEGNFTPASTIDPLTEDVTLKVGDFALTIPAGSFELSKKGKFEFEGDVNGVGVKFEIHPLGNNDYYFEADVEGVDLSGTTFPVDVTLTIGDDAGTTSFSGELEKDGFSQPVSGLPGDFVLAQNYPNPFNPTTAIRFALPEAANVTLRVYSINGQLVRTLISGSVDAGYHSVQWDGANDNGVRVASGVYIYRMSAGGFVQIKKMILMK